ncbi:MAG: hypothetical protein AB7E23_00730 [Bacilli bacterium]
MINRSINATILNTAKEMFNSNQYLDEVVESLNLIENESEYFQSITKDDIKNGLKVSTTITSPVVVVTYKSNSNRYTHQVLNIIIEEAVRYGNENITVFNTSLLIVDLSTNSTYSGVPIVLIHLSFVILGMIIGLISIMIKPMFGQHIYFSTEYEQYPNIKLRTSNKVLFGLFSSKKKDDIVLVNHLEACLAKSNLKTIGFVADKNDRLVDETILSYANHYAKENLRTLIFDFDIFSSKNSHGFGINFEQGDSITLLEKIDKSRAQKVSDNIFYYHIGRIPMYGHTLKENDVIDFIKKMTDGYDQILVKVGTIDMYIILETILNINALIINVCMEETSKIFLDSCLNVKNINNKCFLLFHEK